MREEEWRAVSGAKEGQTEKRLCRRGSRKSDGRWFEEHATKGHTEEQANRHKVACTRARKR